MLGFAEFTTYGIEMLPPSVHYCNWLVNAAGLVIG